MRNYITISSTGTRPITTNRGRNKVTVNRRPQAVSSTPDWEILRDFNSGTLNTNAVGPDGFSSLAGDSVYTTEQVAEGSQSVKMSIVSGDTGFGTFGGAVIFPSFLGVGDVLWLRFSLFLPVGFDVITDVTLFKMMRLFCANAAGSSEGYIDGMLFNQNSSWSENYTFFHQKEGDPIAVSNPISPKTGPGGQLPRGQWHQLAWKVTMDNIRVADGGSARVQFWYNGTLNANHTVFRTLNSAGSTCRSLYLFTFWNGGAPKTQSCYADDIRIAKNGIPSWAVGLEGI